MTTRLVESASPVSATRVTADGASVVVATDDGAMDLRGFDDDGTVARLRVAAGVENAPRLDFANHDTLLLASDKWVTGAFDTQSKRSIWSRPGHVRDVSADGQQLLIGTATGLDVVDAKLGLQQRSFEGPRPDNGSLYNGARLPHDGLAIWRDEADVRVHEYSTGALRTSAKVQLLDLDKQRARCVGHLGAGIGGLWVVDLKTGATVAHFAEASQSLTTACCFHPDGKRWLQGTRHGSLVVWDVATGARLVELGGGGDDLASIQPLDDSGALYVGMTYTGGRPLFWNIDAGAALELGQSIPRDGGETPFFEALRVEGGRVLAATSADFAVWDPFENRRLEHWAPGSRLSAFSFGPHGRVACAVGEDGLGLLEWR